MDNRIHAILCLSILGFLNTECCILSRESKTANCSWLRFKDVPHDLPSWITHIDLSNNDIEIVKDGDFRRLANLRSIILDNNRIRTLERGAFSNLSRLHKLSLDNNTLRVNKTSFKPGVFKPLTNLKTLHISNNIQNCYDFPGLEYYPDREFSYLRNLKRLSLDLYRLPMFGNGFKRMHSLQILRFDKCCLHNFTNSTFENLPSSITELHMTYCNNIRTSVGIDALKPFKNLKVLNLRMTPLSLPSAIELLYPLRHKRMDVIDFHHVNWYPEVNGHHQFSVILTESMFANLKTICMKKLDISFNGIVEILHNTLFSWGPHIECVEHLILSGNAFHMAYEAEFDVLILFRSHYLDLNLTIFEYSYAAIEFPFYSQSDNVQLIKAKHQYKNLTEITDKYRNISALSIGAHFETYSDSSDCTFWNSNHDSFVSVPPKLHTIRLSNMIAYLYFCNYSLLQNNIQTLDLSYSHVDSLYLSVSGLDNLTYFDVSGTDVTKTSLNVLKSLPNLTNLVLQDVNLDRVFMNPNSKNIFHYNSKIRNINLAHNHLTDLPQLFFYNMKNLEKLNLSANSLNTIPSHILNSENLTVIDLSHNGIMGLNKTITDILDKKNSKLRGSLSIHLYGNTFLCTCDYMDFIQWIYETHVRLENKENYICTLSNGTRSTTEAVRRQFHDIFSECKSTFWLTFSIVFVCVFMLILIGSIICFRLRWRIQYFFYRHFHYGYKPIRNDDSVYKFDAFVAYSGEDYIWITSTFREKLETGHSLKLCLHDRDFEPGLSIQQNIINSICNSRKVIIDATPGYIKSKWFEFEIEMANIEMMDRSYDNGIIVIIRNGTKPSDMPDLLRRLWNSITCVLLEEDEDEESFFERIAIALDK
uniref:Toll-like receptor n=1 Tax=Anadara kagoshimensis TaxID=1390362 RepID=A0A7H0S6E7_9BIVA|nr:toll-like receptor [Anadara sativa]